MGKLVDGWGRIIINEEKLILGIRLQRGLYKEGLRITWKNILKIKKLMIMSS